MVLRIGHRGAPHFAPENSLAGFQKAIELGADAVELDVRVTSNNVPVLMHDKTVDRTTNGEGRLARMTLSDARRLKLSNGEPIPTLAEALELLKDQRPVKIDVKTRGIVDPVVRAIKRAGMQRQVVVMGYGRKELLAFRAALPDTVLEVGGVVHHHQRGRAIRLGRRVGASIVSSQYRVTSKRFVAACRKAGLDVHVWTVNDPKLAARMRGYGVAGITTNRLDLV